MLARLQNPKNVQKITIVLILLGLALLLVEIRYEHQVVLGKKWQSWIPLVYTSSMLIIGSFGLRFWNRGGRKAMLLGFAMSAIVGLAGFWFHSKGKPVAAVCHILKVICIPPGHIVIDSGGPPVLAPLSLIGLGLIGMILSQLEMGGADELSDKLRRRNEL